MEDQFRKYLERVKGREKASVLDTKGSHGSEVISGPSTDGATGWERDGRDSQAVRLFLFVKVAF